jgi:hypothetical protein
MSRARVLFAVEAAILGAPAIILALYSLVEMVALLPVVIGHFRSATPDATLIMLLSDPAAVLLAIAALTVLGRLVVCTLNGRRFNFGPLFWGATFYGLVAPFYLFRYTNITTVLLVFGPLYLLAAHAAFKQTRLRRDVTISSSDSGSRLR